MPVTDVYRDSVDDDASDALPPPVLAHLGGRYEIVREAGRGGMATVWLALRRTDGARMALKVLRLSVARALGTERFLREIRIATHVHAPTLMPLEESGEVDGMLYYVMPFAEGGTLRQRLDTARQLTVEDATRIARQLASGVAALHANGFVHRDIKPENVLLDSDGSARVADYGIARALFSAATDLHTSSGIVLGTASYMSPEQAGGESIDGRSDVYAIGCVLYEMLAGTPPFQGASTMAVIARHMNEAPPPLRIVRPMVSPALDAVVSQALAKVPADRFPNATAMMRALDAIALAPPYTAAIPPSARKRGVWAYAGGAALMLLLLGVVLWMLRGPALDPNRVVVMPFTETDRSRSTEGDNLAMLIGSALERTESSQWLDGMSLMTDRERTQVRAISVERTRTVARKAGARYVVDGIILRRRDSVSVAIQLVDAKDGTVLRRASSSAPDSLSISDIALRSMVQVLTALNGLAQVVDVSGLVGHDAAAVDSWLRGERALRLMQMDSAFRLLERAVAQDSTLAPAAFRAAIAASWTTHPDTALSLVRLALRHTDALATRQRPLAAALERFLSGRADDAVIALRAALAPSSETADAWMLAGEIQLHLLPTIGIDSLARRAIPPPVDWPYESFARDAFLRARMIDSTFTPPLMHLAEIAARRGDLAALTRYTARTLRPASDSAFANRMQLTARCLRGGVADVNWTKEARRDARAIFSVGAMLQSAGSIPARRCAVAAFSAILATEPTQGDEYWSSLLGLHTMLVAQGEVRRAIAIVDSALDNGLTQAVGLFVIDRAAGIDVAGRGAGFLQQLNTSIDSRGPPSLWLLALDASRAADAPQLRTIHALLVAKARAPTATRLDSLMQRTVAAYLAVAQHDTARAMSQLERLVPTAAHGAVEMSLWEALAAERLLYARLLLARGQFADAHRVSSTFDQPSVFMHQLYLPASLEIRIAAAHALADRAHESQSRARLASLRGAAAP